MRPQVVFFDLGNTLVSRGEPSPRRLLASRLELSQKQTKKAGRLLMTLPADKPDRVAEALTAILADKHPALIRHTVHTLWQEQMGCVKEIQGATNLVKTLAAEGFKLGIISNTWHPLFQGFCQTCPEIPPLMDYIILSYRLGHKKPAVAIYEHAVMQTGRAAAACWMVGDTYELDLRPAAQAGMRTLWVLSGPEKEKTLLAQVLRGQKPRPDWAVESLEEVLTFFRKGAMSNA